MDGKRFDQMTKSLASGATRRSILKGIVGFGAAAAASAAVPDDSEARRRSRSNTPPSSPEGCSAGTVPCPDIDNCCAEGQCGETGVCCQDGTSPCGDSCCPDCAGYTCGYDCCNSAEECCDGECCSPGNVCLARIFGESAWVDEEQCCPFERSCDGRCCDGSCFSPSGSVSQYAQSCCPSGNYVCPHAGFGTATCCSNDLACCASEQGPICITPGTCCIDADCDDGNPCTIDTCSVGAGCSHTPEPDGTIIAGGVCCNAGQFVEGGNCCSVDACPGAQNGTCQAYAICRDYLCGYDPLPSETICRPAEGDCDLPAVCDGASLVCPQINLLKSTDFECRPAAGECDTAEYCDGISAYCPADQFLSDSNQCRPDSCTGGVATLAALCPGDSPDCPPVQTVLCAPYNCASDAISCLTNCGQDDECVDGFHCDDGQCLPDVEVGGSCDENSDCESEFCADGVCCNTACTGQCEECNSAGMEGVCVPRPDNSLPVGDRQPCAGDGVCGGVCDGQNTATCDYPDQQTLCRESFCLSDSGVQRDTYCNGAGACSLSTGTKICSGYKCYEGDCLDSCSNDSECLGGYHCDDGDCLADIILGGSCDENSVCSGGFCVDGVCCAEACSNGVCCDNGQCCDGVCCGEECCQDEGVCGAVCGPGNTCEYPSSSTVCQEQTCLNERTAQFSRRCDGSGICGNALTQSCDVVECSDGVCVTLGYVCRDGSCLTSCSGHADCAAGFFCDSGKCQPGCTGNEDCPAGYPCSDRECLSICNSNEECTDGYYCDDGACLPDREIGKFCNENSDCASGFCVDNACCENACAGECFQCDAPGQLGSCVLVQDNRGCQPVPDNKCSVGSCNDSGVCEFERYFVNCQDDLLIPACADAASAATCDPTLGCTNWTPYPAGTPCGPHPSGDCDLQNVCDGTSLHCPNLVKPEGEVCREETVCIRAAVCDGISGECSDSILEDGPFCEVDGERGVCCEGICCSKQCYEGVCCDFCGSCTDFQSDNENCGRCGNKCGSSADWGCCDGDCTGLHSNDNCGGCGNTCDVENCEFCQQISIAEGSTCMRAGLQGEPCDPTDFPDSCCRKQGLVCSDIFETCAKVCQLEGEPCNTGLDLCCGYLGLKCTPASGAPFSGVCRQS